VAFRALAAEIATAEPEPFLIMRTLRLTPEHAQQLTSTLHDLAHQAQDASDQARYGLLPGLCQPAQPPPLNPAPSAAPTTGPPPADEPDNETSAM